MKVVRFPSDSEFGPFEGEEMDNLRIGGWQRNSQYTNNLIKQLIEQKKQVIAPTLIC